MAEFATYRYKLMPSAQQYSRLRSIRWQLWNLRNACLQELRDSHRRACREAIRHGRDKPDASDWIVARSEEIADFMSWQKRSEPDLRRRHGQSEERRVAGLLKSMSEGKEIDVDGLRVRPWIPTDPSVYGRSISKYDQYRRLPEIMAPDPEWIGSIPVEILRDQVDVVHRAMDGFYRRLKAGQKPGFPRFKPYDRVRSLGCPIGNGIQMHGDRVTAPMLWHGAIRVSLHRKPEGTAKKIRLTFDGRYWFVTVDCMLDVSGASHAKPGTSCGVDAGVTVLMTFDDGTSIANPHIQEAVAPEIRRLSRRLARAKRTSRARRKAKLALASAHRRMTNRRRTHRHDVANAIVAKAETVFVEALMISNMTRSASGTVEKPGTNVAQKRGLNRSMADAAISTIYTMARYKAARAGGRVIEVDPRYTSRDCSECGGREPGARNGDRYRCPCGAVLNADHNAARNILARGLLAA